MANKKITDIMSNAKEAVQNNDRLSKVLGAVRDKLDEISRDADEKKNFIYQIQTIVRMIKAHITGEYRSFSVQTLLSLAFALIYFITPLDLLPDFIPALGLSDDVSIVLFIFKAVKSDIDQFLDWEQSATSE